MEKQPLESTTIIAALVGIMGYYIFNFTDIAITQDELMVQAQNIFILGTFVYTIYGRWKATGPIKLFKSDTIKVDVSGLNEAEKSVVKSILSGDNE